MVEMAMKAYDDANNYRSSRHVEIKSAIEVAADLANLATRYGRPEAIQTDRGAKFWFAKGDGENLLVEVTGQTPAELRETYRRERQSGMAYDYAATSR
jgi:hypothetical protein